MPSTTTTRPAAPGPRLPEPLLSTTLTVYCAAVADFAPRHAALLACLTPAERDRAGRYARPADAARFVVGRACLRVLLGRCLACPPPAVPLVPNAFGKPQLAPPAAVHFNVAHSGGWVVLAVGAQAVGIDVEKIEPLFDYQAVLAHRFGPAERAELARHPDPRAAFYALWTRHEALAKALGHGLGEGPGHPRAAGWTVRRLEVAPGYAGAVAHPAHWRPTVRLCAIDAALMG